MGPEPLLKLRELFFKWTSVPEDVFYICYKRCRGGKRRRGLDSFTIRAWIWCSLSALCTADLGRGARQPTLPHPIVNRGPLKMHVRSRLCIFNEVCLKYLIASCSFEKQIRLFSLIFDTEMNICKTHTLISLF